MANENIAAQLLSDLKRDYGLTNEQAAGVVGNLMHESGGFNSLQEINPTSGRGGYGYAQWTGPRRTAFENYATRNGLEPSSYEANYGYLKHELATDPYERRQFNTVKNAKTAAEAARLVSDNFLRPGTPNIPSRQNYAQQALGYANSPVPPGSIPSPPGSAVASQLDVRRTAPNPSSQSPLMASSRAVTSPSGGNGDLQTALNRTALLKANTVTPASAEDRVTARNRQFFTPSPSPTPSSIYAQGGPTRPPTDQVGIAPTGRPMLDNGDGSVSTELSMTVTDPRMNGGKPTNVPTIWGGTRLNDEMAMNSALASGQKFTAFPSIPAAEAAAVYRSANEILPSTRPTTSDAARRATLSIGGNQSMAGQERVGPAPAALPRLTIPGSNGGFAGQDRAPSRAMPTLASAAVGGPPTTRSVPTTTVRAGNASANVANQRAEQQATRPAVASTIAAIAPAPPTTSQILNGTGFRGGGSVTAPDRLPSIPMPRNQPAPTIMAGPESVALVGNTVDASGKLTTVPAQTNIPLPRPRPISAPQGGSPLMASSAPASRPLEVLVQGSNTVRPVAPRPFQRPSFQAPLMATSRQPLNILVQGSNTVQSPAPTPQQIIAAGLAAVSQSGDTSSGSQLEAAQARASGEGGRTRRY